MLNNFLNKLFLFSIEFFVPKEQAFPRFFGIIFILECFFFHWYFSRVIQHFLNIFLVIIFGKRVSFDFVSTLCFFIFQENYFVRMSTYIEPSACVSSKDIFSFFLRRLLMIYQSVQYFQDRRDEDEHLVSFFGLNGGDHFVNCPDKNLNL